MSDLRKAAQQALEALEKVNWSAAQDWHKAFDYEMDALRAALAQEQAEPVQGPVAKVELMTTGGNAGLATRIVEIDDHLRERLRPGQLLYTTPPQRKPLTEEEIKAVLTSVDPETKRLPPGLREFARAIERKVRGEA